jgi:hypothetical protein
LWKSIQDGDKFFVESVSEILSTCMCNINDFGFNSYCLSWVKKVSHGSVGWLRCHNSEDMGMLGIPCPLFSRLNSKTRSHKWNPFREQLGMCWHCWLDFTTWLTLGCSSQSVSVWPVFTISVDFFCYQGRPATQSSKPWASFVLAIREPS